MKIAVLRALQLGDLLCSVPALRALRGAYPQAHVTLVGLPWARWLAARLPRYVDAFAEFPGFPGLPERTPDLAALPRFLAAMRRARFELVLQLHGSGELTNPLAALLEGRRTAGFYRPGHWCPAPDDFLLWRDREHEVRRWLRLLELLGVPEKGMHLEYPLQPEDYAEINPLNLGHYAVLHPGSQLPSRRWPAARFAEVGDALSRDGLRVVISGTAAEAAITGEVRRAMREPASDLAGRTSLGGLGALLRRARLLVCNDTGVSHIAAAMRTPSVVVSCGSDPQRWAPLDRQLHRVLHEDIECRPCGYAECPRERHPCASAISPADVLREVHALAECAA